MDEWSANCKLLSTFADSVPPIKLRQKYGWFVLLMYVATVPLSGQLKFLAGPLFKVGFVLNKLNHRQ